MLFLSRKKGQATAEYAILIALIIGAVVAMQIYIKRATQARYRNAAIKFSNEMKGNQGDWTELGGNALAELQYQFEPTDVEARSSSVSQGSSEMSSMTPAGAVTRTASDATAQSDQDYQLQLYNGTQGQ